MGKGDFLIARGTCMAVGLFIERVPVADDPAPLQAPPACVSIAVAEHASSCHA